MYTSTTQILAEYEFEELCTAGVFRESKEANFVINLSIRQISLSSSCVVFFCMFFLNVILGGFVLLRSPRLLVFTSTAVNYSVLCKFSILFRLLQTTGLSIKLNPLLFHVFGFYFVSVVV